MVLPVSRPAPSVSSGDVTVRRDLDDRAQVHDAVVAFYRDVVFDDVLGPVFDEVAEVDWATHIPTLVDYWCRVLFGSPGGARPLLGVHASVHDLEPLSVDMFDRWFGLWSATVDERCAGLAAERAKAHAARVAATLARRVAGLDWTGQPGDAGVPA